MTDQPRKPVIKAGTVMVASRINEEFAALREEIEDLRRRVQVLENRSPQGGIAEESGTGGAREV